MPEASIVLLTQPQPPLRAGHADAASRHAALHLVDDIRIRRREGGRVTYHHLLFVTHGYGSAVRVALKRHEAARVRP